jgi:Uma2 family endonuclease
MWCELARVYQEEFDAFLERGILAHGFLCLKIAYWRGFSADLLEKTQVKIPTNAPVIPVASIPSGSAEARRIISGHSDFRGSTMGHAVTKEFLIARWTALINDPSLHDLPYKIELNSEGTIEMSPANNRHGMKQADIAYMLRSAFPNGRVITECSVLTDIGVRVPDVAWASQAFLAQEGENTPFLRAPEICVEVRSPSNSEREINEKIRAYLAAGAVEVWVADEAGGIKIHGTQGELSSSSFGVKLQP